MCVRVRACSLLKITAVRWITLNEGSRCSLPFTQFPIQHTSLLCLRYVSEATALRQNCSSGRCNVSWLHNHQHAWRRKHISVCRVEDIAEETRISTVSFRTHLKKIQATDPTFTKKLSQHLSMGIYVWQEYFLKAVRVLHTLYTCSHELIFAY